MGEGPVGTPEMRRLTMMKRCYMPAASMGAHFFLSQSCDLSDDQIKEEGEDSVRPFTSHSAPLLTAGLNSKQSVKQSLFPLPLAISTSPSSSIAPTVKCFQPFTVLPNPSYKALFFSQCPLPVPQATTVPPQSSEEPSSAPQNPQCHQPPGITPPGQPEDEESLIFFKPLKPKSG